MDTAHTNQSDLVLQFFEEIGGYGTSSDIIRYAEESTIFQDVESRYRFQAQVYARVSELVDSGHLTWIEDTINFRNGGRIERYEINRGEIIPPPKETPMTRDEVKKTLYFASLIS